MAETIESLREQLKKAQDKCVAYREEAHQAVRDLTHLAAVHGNDYAVRRTKELAAKISEIDNQE